MPRTFERGWFVLWVLHLTVGVTSLSLSSIGERGLMWNKKYIFSFRSRRRTSRHVVLRRSKFHPIFGHCSRYFGDNRV